MRKSLVLLALNCCLAFATVAQQHSTGVLRYQIFPANTSNRVAKPTDLLEVNYRMAIGSTDSVLTETFTANQPVHIPVKHPSFKDILLKIKPEDRLEITVSADSFYKYTIGQPLPAYIHAGDSLTFYMKIYDVMSAAELINKQSQADKDLMIQDSIALADFIKGYPKATATKSGIYLIKYREGVGRNPGIGDSVLVKYKTYLFNGKVVDKSKDTGFEFMVGAKLVIPGWEEAIRLMKEGSRYKIVVPYLLAYGADGNGSIPPYTSVVFDLELLKVK
jgi:FKBP-type peptidyl-prolyl cis-trans isomerase